MWCCCRDMLRISKHTLDTHTCLRFIQHTPTHLQKSADLGTLKLWFDFDDSERFCILYYYDVDRVLEIEDESKFVYYSLSSNPRVEYCKFVIIERRLPLFMTHA